jgi:hypothetical protein
MDIRVTRTLVVGDNRQLASCWPPMGTCASCGIESYRNLRAPCIAQDRKCNECGTYGHLARACKTKRTWHETEDGGPTRRKKEAPTGRGGPPGDTGEHAQGTNYVKKEPRSRRSQGGRAHKRQKTQHTSSYYDQPAAGSSAMHTTTNTNTQGQQMQLNPAVWDKT